MSPEVSPKHKDQCLYTFVTCKYNKNHGFYRFHEQQHYSICSSRPIACRYCKKQINMDILNEHQSKCPKAPIECKYKDIGCQFAHQTRDTIKHHYDNYWKHQKFNCLFL